MRQYYYDCVGYFALDAWNANTVFTVKGVVRATTKSDAFGKAHDALLGLARRTERIRQRRLSFLNWYVRRSR